MADFEASKNYTYRETSEIRQFNKNGQVSKTERETNEVLILAGRRVNKWPNQGRFMTSSK